MTKQMRLYKVSEYQKEFERDGNVCYPEFKVDSDEIIVAELNEAGDEVTLPDGKKLGWILTEDVLHESKGLVYEDMEIWASDDDGDDYYMELVDTM
jgi:hypothetical protein